MSKQKEDIMEENKNILDYLKPKAGKAEEEKFLNSYFENFSDNLLEKIKQDELQKKASQNKSKIIYLLVDIAASVLLVFGIIRFSSSSSIENSPNLMSEIELEAEEFDLELLQEELINSDTSKIIKKVVKEEKVIEHQGTLPKVEKSFEELLNDLDDEELMQYLNSSEVELEDLDI
jgi:hypothetical protein